MIEVTVLLFAALRDRVGSERVSLRVPSETPIGGLWAHVPELADIQPPAALRYAVNHEWTVPGASARDGDEVAFILPVSGG
jgi:molybdopterin converting factor small subunit